MKIHHLYQEIFEAKDPKVHDLLSHHMPHTLTFPDMDPNYEFYRFVVAMAGTPETNNAGEESPLRDIPLAVAYAPQEAEMIHKVCHKMGIKHTVLANQHSRELPTTHKVSPVPKRRKFE